MKITEVYLEDDLGPAQGACEVDGERLVFEREGAETLLYRLMPDEWTRIDSPPQTETDFNDLAALHLLMKARGPVTALGVV